jgi:alpha-glucoside transport system ATP-binding protein
MAAVKLTNIKKAYDKVEVMHGVDLTIEQGEFVVFVGPSGCGKSTLLRMIAGLETITSGELEIDGIRVNDIPPSLRGIAMVFQSYALYPHMTVYDNMAFSMRLTKANKSEIDERVSKAAEMLQLTDYLNRLPKALSGGQRQRVAIGRAIVRNPKVFLFDEPLSNLDAALRVATRLEIANLKESMPETTMVYVTHDQVEAMTLADRIVVLSAGYIEQVGAPLELYQNPANLFVAKFIGSPAMNILPATLSKAGSEISEVALADGVTLAVPIETPTNDQGDSVNVGIRPEDIMCLEQGENTDNSATNVAVAEVVFVESLGEVTMIYVDMSGLDEPFVIKKSGIHHYKKGDKIHFFLPPEKMHLFTEEGKSYRFQGS